MKLRQAHKQDLSQLKTMYEKIVEDMNENNICIWDDIYPYKCFENDIKNHQLFVLVENEIIISAFALSSSHDGVLQVEWEDNDAKALYIDRVGVHVDYLRKGIGSQTLEKAITLSKERKAKYLRLFVVDSNKPAINLYLKNGFKQVSGVYEEYIDEDLTLKELGFEINLD